MEGKLTIEDIESANERIKSQIKQTPLDKSFKISSMLDCNLYLKMEMLQRCKAFKFRGALSKISKLPKGSTIVCASAGNHSQGCALSAKICDLNCIVYMPLIAPEAKVIATRGYGAEVRQFGQSFDEALAKCKEELQAHPEYIFIPPFDDLDVMAGQGTIGLEIARDLKEAQTVVIPVGGGGLCAGVSTAIKTLLPNCRIVAVNAAACPYTYMRYQKDKNRPIDPLAESEPKVVKKSLADGISVKVAGSMTYPIMLKNVDEFVVVTEEEIACSISLLAERAKMVVEGSGAATLAAVMFKKFKYEKDENIVCILSGGNIPLYRLSECFSESANYLKQHF